MGVKLLWAKSLGDFRCEERKLLSSLSDKVVAIDTSAWVHMLDRKWDIQYARTSKPAYAHPGVLSFFEGRVRALDALGIEPIFVFDGKSPSLKTFTNRQRQKKSQSARTEYDSIVTHVKAANHPISEEMRRKAWRLRLEISRPIPEEYASLAEWFTVNNIGFVQAPFEADAQIKKLIMNGEATAAITEDGDLVVYEVPHALSQTKINVLAPKESSCNYFDVAALKAGDYNSEIAKGQRSSFLAEISCFSGNDYISNLPNIGPAKIFGSCKGKKTQTALIDSFIKETATDKTKTEEQWLDDLVKRTGKRKRGDNDLADEEWSPQKFIAVRNLIKHYPVFEKDETTGTVSLVPLNPLPDGVSNEEWGAFIGFEKHPKEYFDHSLEDYYDMTIVGSNNHRREETLGPRYTAAENPDVDPRKLVPLFAKLNFDQDPLLLQPNTVLRFFLLSRGITAPENTPTERIREMAESALEVGNRRPVLDPMLVPKPAKWVGFEPLDEVDIGDEFDDWNYEFVDKIRSLRVADDSFIDEHFGTERAQYQRLTAFELLDGGNIGLSTMMIRNVASQLRPGQKLIAIKYKCLSKERGVLHSCYMVFENEDKKDYIPSPASYCTCENGAFFCSHMLCFFYVMRAVQHRWREKSQRQIEDMWSEDRRIIQGKPCLIENILAKQHISRQRGQSRRQSKRTRTT